MAGKRILPTPGEYSSRHRLPGDTRSGSFLSHFINTIVILDFPVRWHRKCLHVVEISIRKGTAMSKRAGGDENMHRTTGGTNGGTDPGRGRGKRLPLIAAAILAGVVALGAAGWLGGIFPKTYAEIAKSAGVVETADVVKIPLKALDSSKALFLQQEVDGRQLYYFALKSSDDAYRAAFDACNGCFRTNLGYRQEEDRMVCNKCGVAFPSVRIEEIKGGCNPHPLARKVEGQYLVIRKGDIAAGKNYFPGNRS